MNQTLVDILKSREDISDYVFHFTKHADAVKSLQSILRSQAIIDIYNKGYICFSEAPITMLPDMFSIFEKYNDPMYAPYGIGFRKEFIYNLGGRPVIYGDHQEIEDLPESIKWKGVEYVPGMIDFSWLREWRINTHEVKLVPQQYIVITKCIDEELELCYDLLDVDIDGDVEEGGTVFMGWANGKFKRLLKGISLEEIRNANSMSKKELDDRLQKRNIGDEEIVNLGSFINDI